MEEGTTGGKNRIEKRGWSCLVYCCYLPGPYREREKKKERKKGIVQKLLGHDDSLDKDQSTLRKPKKESGWIKRIIQKEESSDCEQERKLYKDKSFHMKMKAASGKEEQKENKRILLLNHTLPSFFPLLLLLFLFSLSLLSLCEWLSFLMIPFVHSQWGWPYLLYKKYSSIDCKKHILPFFFPLSYMTDETLQKRLLHSLNSSTASFFRRWICVKREELKEKWNILLLKYGFQLQHLLSSLSIFEKSTKTAIVFPLLMTKKHMCMKKTMRIIRLDDDEDDGCFLLLL